jgi:hypothetical protein
VIVDKGGEKSHKDIKLSCKGREESQRFCKKKSHKDFAKREKRYFKGERNQGIN